MKSFGTNKISLSEMNRYDKILLANKIINLITIDIRYLFSEDAKSSRIFQESEKINRLCSYQRILIKDDPLDEDPYLDLIQAILLESPSREAKSIIEGLQNRSSDLSAS